MRTHPGLRRSGGGAGRGRGRAGSAAASRTLGVVRGPAGSRGTAGATPCCPGSRPAQGNIRDISYSIFNLSHDVWPD